MSLTPDTLISIRNVSYRYGREQVLTDISLDVSRGDFLGVIGPNGSGKTTLLRIMLGLLTPQSGSVALFGTDIRQFRDWKRIGYVPQRIGSAGLSRFPITVAEVVAMGASDRTQVNEALAAVSMEPEKNAVLHELSGGQQQRVAIARALASQPELLILDEPTVGVDADSQARFYQLLQDLNRSRQLTLILVSHDVDVVAHEVNQIACINNTLVCHGRPKEILKSDFMEKLYGKELRFVVHGH